MNSSSSVGFFTLGYKLADVTWVHAELAASSTKASCIASNLLKSTVGTNLPHPKKKTKGKCMFLPVKIKCSPWVGKLMEHKSHANL